MLNVVPVSSWTNGATGRLEVENSATMPFDIVMHTATRRRHDLSRGSVLKQTLKTL